MREFFLGPITVIGSATFAGSGQVTFSGIVSQVGSSVRTGFATFNAPTRINTPVIAPAGSANTQMWGFTRLNSGSTSVPVSTSVVKSNALILLGAPILAGAAAAAQASGVIPSGLCVGTITDGSFFTIAWLGSGISYAQNVDVPWQITLQA